MDFIFFSRAHGTFSRIDHILGHESNFGKLKKKKYMKSFQASFWSRCYKTDVEAEAPIIWPSDAKNWLTGKDPDAEKD